MTRLIDADALKESVDEHTYLVTHGFNETEYGITRYGIHQVIDEQPTIDAEPVRHGKWMGTVCSECGASVSFYYDCDYCPCFGARMDKE